MLQTTPIQPQPVHMPLLDSLETDWASSTVPSVNPVQSLHDLDQDRADYLEAKAAYASYIASGEEAVSWEQMKQELQL